MKNKTQILANRKPTHRFNKSTDKRTYVCLLLKAVLSEFKLKPAKIFTKLLLKATRNLFTLKCKTPLSNTTNSFQSNSKKKSAAERSKQPLKTHQTAFDSHNLIFKNSIFLIKKAFCCSNA